MGVGRDWKEKWMMKIEIKNEQVQQLRSEEVPQGLRSMESCALMWGTRGLASQGLGTPFRGHFRGPTRAPGSQIFGPSLEIIRNLLVVTPREPPGVLLGVF